MIDKETITADKNIDSSDKSHISEATPQQWQKDDHNIPHKYQKRRKSHGLRNFLIALILMLTIIASAVAYLIFFVAGPLVKAVDSLPADFPKDIAIYQLDQAKIKVQSADAKNELIKLASSLPDWSLEPFIRYILVDSRTQILAGIKDPGILPKNITVNGLADQLKTEAAALNTKTVGLEWQNLPKTKEEIFEYYKDQLEAKGFTVKEKIVDYEIDFSFFKPGIDGAMTIADSFMKENASLVNMTVNYLPKL